MGINVIEKHANITNECWYILQIDGHEFEVPKSELINLAGRIDYLMIDPAVRDQPKGK